MSRSTVHALIACALLAAPQAGCSQSDENHGHEDEHGHEGHGHAKKGDDHEGHGHKKKGDDHEGHGHAKKSDDHEGHGHAKMTYDRTLPERVKKTRCEHKVPILQCKNCRYEVGAVKIPQSMLKKEGLVQTARVSTAPGGVALKLTGEVAFDERKVVHVSPRIGGVARRVFVTTGDHVKAGAALVETDSLELGRLQSRYLQARARLKLATYDHEREKRLFAGQISSARDRLRAATAVQQARIELATARDQLRLIGFSDRTLARLQASTRGKRGGRIVIRAPMAGVVVAKHVVPGERLSADKEVLTIADLRSVWVLAAVYERDLARLLTAKAAGKLQAVVKVAAFPGRDFSGVVDYIGATMDEATRTVKVRVAAANEALLLRPGMFADASIYLGKGTKVVLVPDQAVVSDGASRFVFVSAGERLFFRRDVRVGATRGAKVVIVGGLKAGEEVVVKGAFLLKSDILREKMGAGCAD